ncbi:MAG: restriction endonuclease subunit S [Polaromonas sp.]|nr:restriction endonuclease subunit S [Polaromonas sp.]
MSKPWPRVKLGHVLKRSDETAQPAVDAEYKEITIRLWGKGVIERGRVSGASVNGRRFIARKDQFIASRIDARNGAMGIVPSDLDGALVTNDFPLFSVNHDRLLPQYMGWLCRTPAFVDLCARASEGTTNRVRLKEAGFLNLEIEIPDTDAQHRIVARIDVVQQQLQQASKLRSSIDHDIASLLAVRFQETLQHAEWRPMREVAPIVRRDVVIDQQSSYAELGIRSFGKGTFHKPTLTGSELGDKRVYRIEPGDLLFSNVFAWEGAIAMAKPEDVGRVGSHRFISCVPHGGLITAEYLHYYFLTDEGMTKIRDASPGGAGRNRTLGLSKLLSITVPMPPTQVQRQFVEFQSALTCLTKIRKEEVNLVGAVLPALLHGTLSSEM